MGTHELNVHVMDKELSAASKGMKLNEITESLPELERYCERKIDAAEQFSDAVKLAALKGGVDASVLSTYVNAKVNDTLKKKQNQAEQLTLLFDNLG